MINGTLNKTEWCEVHVPVFGNKCTHNETLFSWYNHRLPKLKIREHQHDISGIVLNGSGLYGNVTVMF